MTCAVFLAVTSLAATLLCILQSQRAGRCSIFASSRNLEVNWYQQVKIFTVGGVLRGLSDGTFNLTDIQ